MARAVSAVMRADRTVVLGVGLALVGALYAGAMARNYRLSRALVAKDRDMAQLVTKVGACLLCFCDTYVQQAHASLVRAAAPWTACLGRDTTD